jgi:hypothetical protein
MHPKVIWRVIAIWKINSIDRIGLCRWAGTFTGNVLPAGIYKKFKATGGGIVYYQALCRRCRMK